MTMITTFNISNQDILACYNYAVDIRDKHGFSVKDFKTVDRTPQQIINNTVEGKLSELVFSMFCDQFDTIKPVPDFRVFGNPLQSDFGQDMPKFTNGSNDYQYMNRIKIDIKATRSFSHWLLVESGSFKSNVYVLVKLGYDNETKDPEYFKKENANISGEVAGFVHSYDIIEMEKRQAWFVFNQNDMYYDTKVLEKLKVNGTPMTPDYLREWLKEEQKDPHFPWNRNSRQKAGCNFAFPDVWLRKTEQEWGFLFRLLFLSRVDPVNQQVLNATRS
jgi:hypothetical protein